MNPSLLAGSLLNLPATPPQGGMSRRADPMQQVKAPFTGFYGGNVATLGNNLVVGPSSGRVIRVLRASLASAGNVSAYFASTGGQQISPTYTIGSGPGAIIALNAVAANTTSAVYNLGGAFTSASLQVILTGSPSGGTITVQASLDGVNFDTTAGGILLFTIGTDASGVIKFEYTKPFVAFRVVLASLAGGTAPTVTAIVAPGGTVGGHVVEPFCEAGVFQTFASEGLNLNLSAATSVGVSLTYQVLSQI